MTQRKPDLPPEAVQHAAEVMLRQYESMWGAGHLGWREFEDDAREVLAAALPHAGPVVTEHAQLMSGGGFHVRNADPVIEKIYPLREWIVHSQRFGGQVYRRKVVVVEDWAKVRKRRETRPGDEEGDRG